MDGKNVLLHGRDRLSVAIEEHVLRLGCRVTRLDRVAEDLLNAASVLVIADDDDPGNVDLALTVRQLNESLPLVVRLFDEALAAHLRETLKGVRILSMSALAAPAFVEGAIRAIETVKHSQPSGVRKDSEGEYRPGFFARIDSVLVTAVGGLVAILILFTVFFAITLELPVIDAMYFVWTTVTTVGYGDIALRDSSAMVKIAGMVLMFAGASFLAVLFGLFTDWVVSRRLDILRGRVRVRSSGHLVIAGGGNVGFRTAEQFATRAIAS